MLRQSCCIFLCLLLSGITGILVSGEFYSSIDSMQTLGHVERVLVTATRLYLTEQQQQLDMYRSFVKRVKREHSIAREQQVLDEDYLNQPLQAFRLIKRLVVDWHDLNEQLAVNQPMKNYRETVNTMAQAQVLPNRQELQGAARGLVRLQRVYNLTAIDMADGYLNGIFTGTPLLWSDSFEMGVLLYEMDDYNGALEWLMVAANLLHDVDGKKALKMYAEVYEYLVLTYIELGETDAARATLTELLSWQPAHPLQHAGAFLEQRMPKCPREQEEMPWFANYSRLCQGQRLSEIEKSGSCLLCFLDSKRNAFFKLSPLKVEQVHRDPDIHIYYDLLNDAQINRIIKVADEFYSLRSYVNGRVLTELRVSQQVWLNYSSPIMRSVSKLVGAVSGLDMGNAELIQIANYGIGGQYAPHTDYMKKLPEGFAGKGDRISTNMFYLSDVLQGGYTVFPKLNVFLQPIKGALVIWHNLHRSLNFDSRTVHAGCPVIEGTKRIGNIWIHSARQEFRRPCSLNSKE